MEIPLVLLLNLILSLSISSAMLTAPSSLSDEIFSSIKGFSLFRHISGSISIIKLRDIKPFKGDSIYFYRHSDDLKGIEPELRG